MIGRKNHHACTRRCDWVRKRSKCSCTKKKRANSAFSADTTTNHGTAITRKSASPRSHSMRFRMPRLRVRTITKNTAAPANTMPMSPLESTASAIDAHAASIQRRPARRRPASASCSARRSAKKVAVVQSVSPMSRVTMPPSAMKYGLESSTSIAARLAPGPWILHAAKPTMRIVARPQTMT